MAAVTAITKDRIGTAGGRYMWIYEYTKANAADTIDCSGEFGEIRGVISKTAAGTDDPASVSGTTVTLSAGTTAPCFAIIMGDPA